MNKIGQSDISDDFNWINEAAKLAPTLNPILFGSGNRQEILNNLQPFDLLICSYGLLQQEFCLLYSILDQCISPLSSNTIFI